MRTVVTPTIIAAIGAAGIVIMAATIIDKATEPRRQQEAWHAVIVSGYNLIELKRSYLTVCLNHRRGYTWTSNAPAAKGQVCVGGLMVPMVRVYK